MLTNTFGKEMQSMTHKSLNELMEEDEEEEEKRKQRTKKIILTKFDWLVPKFTIEL